MPYTGPRCESLAPPFLDVTPRQDPGGASGRTHLWHCLPTPFCRMSSSPHPRSQGAQPTSVEVRLRPLRPPSPSKIQSSPSTQARNLVELWLLPSSLKSRLNRRNLWGTKLLSWVEGECLQAHPLSPWQTLYLRTIRRRLVEAAGFFGMVTLPSCRWSALLAQSC